MRIGVDGYNLGMAHGTGVATYGFALAEAIRGLGHEVEGVFGIDVGSDRAVQEVLFFDHVTRDDTERKGSHRSWSRWLHHAEALFRQPRAREIRQTDMVQREAFASRLPRFDRLTSTPHLFEVAHKHFSIFGKFLKLRVENPPEVMHWTYPLPIEMVESRNVYPFMTWFHSGFPTPYWTSKPSTTGS